MWRNFFTFYFIKNICVFCLFSINHIRCIHVQFCRLLFKRYRCVIVTNISINLYIFILFLRWGWGSSWYKCILQFGPFKCKSSINKITGKYSYLFFSSVYLITLLNVFISYMFSYVYLWNYKSTLWTCEMTRRTQQNKKISILPLWLNEKVCRINHFYLYIDCCHCMTAIGKTRKYWSEKEYFWDENHKRLYLFLNNLK